MQVRNVPVYPLSFLRIRNAARNVGLKLSSTVSQQHDQHYPSSVHLPGTTPARHYSSQVMSVPRARRRLARIRCLQDCVDRFQENEPLPRSLCFVPSEVDYKCPNNSVIPIYSEPNKAKTKKIQEIICAAGSKVIVSGEEFYNNFGKWVKGKKVKFMLHYVKVDNINIQMVCFWQLQFNRRSFGL